MGYSEAACRQLAASVSMVTEGESRALPWPRHIVGRNNVARLFAAIGPAMNRIGVIMDLQQVNCPPSAVFRDRNGKALGAFALDILDGRIQRIRWVDHPNSLGIR